MSTNCFYDCLNHYTSSTVCGYYNIIWLPHKVQTDLKSESYTASPNSLRAVLSTYTSSSKRLICERRKGRWETIKLAIQTLDSRFTARLGGGKLPKTRTEWKEGEFLVVERGKEISSPPPPPLFVSILVSSFSSSRIILLEGVWI